MCDTLVAKSKNAIFFGKNSDRSPNEPNLTVFYPSQNDYPPRLDCTYIHINQVAHRFATLLVQPSWQWGAEMGVNEKGVIIGNEAVFTTSQHKSKKLIGMDFVRLALERAANAGEAVEVITDLLKKHGQGGNCGFDKPFYYDNSYLISDLSSAFIVETAGTSYKVKEVIQSGNISNRLSIQDEQFAKTNTEKIFTFFSGSKNRSDCVGKALSEKTDPGISDIMAILRSHRPKDEKKLFTKGSIKSVCMHKSFLGDHTTGSMIVQSRSGLPSTIWLNGCSTPCLSLYKPCFFGVIVPPVFTSKEESLPYWLQREYLVRAIYAGLVPLEDYRKGLERLQTQFVTEETKLFKSIPTIEQLTAFAKKCSLSEQSFVDSYQGAINQVKNHEIQLPKPWEKKTRNLGKNVFERDLEKRIAK